MGCLASAPVSHGDTKHVTSSSVVHADNSISNTTIKDENGNPKTNQAPPPASSNPTIVKRNSKKKISKTKGSKGKLFEKYMDFREDKSTYENVYNNPPDDLPFIDKNFEREDKIDGEKVVWKRPREFQEFLDNPVLFSDGVDRHDIEQGNVGNCWLQAGVAAVADRSDLLHKAVPLNAWNEKGGYFHCRLWRFGRWEDIYIDDYLPVRENDNFPFGARGRNDKNEIWPSLLEKAFARMYGGYKYLEGNIDGGLSSKFRVESPVVTLTGGFQLEIDLEVEEIKHKEIDAETVRDLHVHLKNAYKKNAMMSAGFPNNVEKKLQVPKQGLVSDHEYTLTGAVTVTNNKGDNVNLLRLRNPAGCTEWTGPWSDGSPEWSTIDDSQLQHVIKDDGEFWIHINDFVKFFHMIRIGSLTPDFHQYSQEDSIRLEYHTGIFGRWEGETAAGNDRDVMLNNPIHHFHVDKSGADVERKVPLVIHILEHTKVHDSLSVELYKIHKEFKDKDGMVAIMSDIEPVEPRFEVRVEYKYYRVKPGNYAVVPMTDARGLEQDYLIRIYSPVGLSDVRNMGQEYMMMRWEKEFEDSDNLQTQCVCNEWRCDVNSGGTISSDSFHKNPQVVCKVARGKSQMLNFFIMKNRKNTEDFSIGIKLVNLQPDAEVPLTQEYLVEHYDNGPKNEDEEAYDFVIGDYASASYMLSPGKYVAVLYMADTSQHATFVMGVQSASIIKMQPYNFV